MLTEELFVLDVDSYLWPAVRPLLGIVLRLEQNDERYSWHGWRKREMSAFLKGLPERCSLVVGVWETFPGEQAEHERLVLGVVCEVVAGEICSLRTFEALATETLKPVKELEPGIEDALEIIRAARLQVAPVAWALFTDKATWDTWLWTDENAKESVNKGEQLATYARQGRCVLMGSQTSHRH